MSSLLPSPAIKRLCVVLCAVLLLTGCGLPGEDEQVDPIASCLDSLSAPALATGVFVEPNDGLAPILDELNAAQCSIDVTVYLLTDRDVIGALAAAVDREVRVRVILEEHPFGGGGTEDDIAAVLRAEGIEVQWSANRYQLTHAKYIVVDEAVALIMNQNLTFSAVNDNREFGVLTTDPAMLDQVNEVFADDWHRSWGDASEGPLVLSPENSRETFLGLIGGAQTSVDFYAEVIRDDEIIGALGQAVDRGVKVRLILNANLDEDDQDVAARLFDLGVEIRLANHVYIHAKTMIFDGASAVIGSQNYTATSLDYNREVGVVVSDPLLVGRCVQVFEGDWIVSEPGAPA